MTLSAAETKWAPLLKSLLVNKRGGQDVTDNEVENLTFNPKLNLIRNNPVTCARYFDFKIRKLFNLLKKHYVFESHYIVDSYKRTEFQGRGSPHIHYLKACNKSS